LIDSGIAGICLGTEKDGKFIIETDDGLLIPVTRSQIIISEPVNKLNLEKTAIKGKNERPTPKVASRSVRQDRSRVMEIDLHTSVQPNSQSGPTPGDLLTLQLDKFSRALNVAFMARKELIAIHGEGSGKLKNEIRRIAGEMFPDCEVMDAPFYRYGKGATRIIIR
jgi:hypothetical protein